MPIILGGDCSVGHQAVKGLDCFEELDIIHFDSHLDWTKPLNGQPYFNGSPMRCNSTLPYVKNMIHLGIRGIGSSGPADFEEARANGDKIYSVKDYRRVGIEEILKNINLAVIHSFTSILMLWTIRSLKELVLQCLVVLHMMKLLKCWSNR